MRGMFGPYMSASTSPTLAPVSRSARARLTATVDFPTPPFPEDTAMVCFTSGMRGSAGGLGGPGTAWVLDDPMATLTPETPGTWPTTLRAWLWISTFATAGCVVKLEGERHLPALDRQRLDQSKAHNVFLEVWVLNGP